MRELAEYLGQLNPEDAELPKRCADKLAAKDLGAVLGEIAARAPAVCDNATSGEAIEQVFNCIILLGSTLDVGPGAGISVRARVVRELDAPLAHLSPTM